MQTKPIHCPIWRSSGKRIARPHLAGLVATCIIGLTLCGCSERSGRLDTGQSLIDKRDEVVAGSPHGLDPAGMVSAPTIPLPTTFGGSPGGGRLPSISSGARVPPSAQEADYIDKADVYWKLNWIRQRILYGALPRDLARMVARTRTEMMTTRRDINFDRGNEALTHLEAGVRHWQAERDIEAVCMHAVTIPWRTGSDTIERFIASGGLGFGGRPVAGMEMSSDGAEENLYARPITPSAMETLTPSQTRAIGIVRRYAEQLHSSPQEEMRRQWRLAVHAINAMRDGLGLQGRKENSDGDFSEPGIATERTTADEIDRIFPTSDNATTGSRDKHALELPDPPSDPFLSNPDAPRRTDPVPPVGDNP